MATLEKIKILVIDDSVFMRNAYKRLLVHNDFEIIGFAENGKIGVEKALELNPDIIIMDIEMPVMNGLEATKLICEQTDIKVLIVSTLSKDGAEATVEALANGAIDFIEKITDLNNIDSLKDKITNTILELSEHSSIQNRIQRRMNINVQEKLAKHINNSLDDNPDNLAIAQKLLKKAKKSSESKAEAKEILKDNIDIILIGISTGGPIALNKILKDFSPNIDVPIIIVQHMPAHFTHTLAKRLDNICPLTIKEAQDGDNIKTGHIYFAPGGKQLILKSKRVIAISESSDSNVIFKPSVDISLESINRFYKGRTLGIMMTGMGSDGAKQFKALKYMGGSIICQSKESCIVAGMVSSVIKQDISDEIVPLDKIAEKINSIFA